MSARADILLATINAKWIHPSLALRLLRANLGGLEGRCEILEFALRQPLHEKLEPLVAARPRILGLSVSIWNHRATLELLKELRLRTMSGRRPLVVLGGPEVSWLPSEAEIFRHADYVIRGEGEEAFRTLCEDILGEAPAKNAREPEKKACGTEAAPKAVNLLPGPVNVSTIDPGYRLYTGEDLRRKLVYVEASRGCAFHCEFCLSAACAGPVREFPLEPFLADMDRLVRRGAGTFKFLDRSFNLNPERARRIMEFFLERIEAEKRKRTEGAPESPDPAGTEPPGRPLCVHFEMVPSRFPPELRETLRRFPPGSLRLEIGIQTLNGEAAARIGRQKDTEKELELLSFLRRETSAIIHADLIAALPGEDFASFARGFDRLWIALSAGRGPPPEKSPPPEIQLGILKLLPGAPIARHTENFGMRYNPAPPYEAIETAALPAADLDRIKNFARFWELIVNRDAFPGITPAAVPPGEPVFERFMTLSDRLLARFGRNWGIDREDLKQALLAGVP
jgi:radical SAM superfamily enzyme YgiQ (UPF0313 family)